jgi:hypothetical protein
MQRKKRCPLHSNSDRKSGFPHKVMSALHPKADMCSATGDVCFGPIADIRGPSLDYFIGEGQQPWWHLKTKRFGGLKVDH